MPQRIKRPRLAAILAGAGLALALAMPVPAEARDREGSEHRSDKDPTRFLKDSRTVRDGDGNRVGRIDRDNDGDLTFRNEQGFRTGRAERNSDGGYTLRDQQGFRSGRIEGR